MNKTTDINQLLVNNKGEVMQHDIIDPKTKKAIGKEDTKCIDVIEAIMMQDDMQKYFANPAVVKTVGTFVSAKDKQEVLDNAMINVLVDHVCVSGYNVFVKHQLSEFLRAFMVKKETTIEAPSTEETK